MTTLTQTQTYMISSEIWKKNTTTLVNYCLNMSGNSDKLNLKQAITICKLYTKHMHEFFEQCNVDDENKDKILENCNALWFIKKLKKQLVKGI